MSALNTIRVLELAESVAGEYCGKLLADFGAEVIKLERPGSGSPTRHLGPLIDKEAEADDRGADSSDYHSERSALFAYLNTGKHSIAVDLDDASGRETLERLLASVDAVIDDHGAAWLKRFGLDRAASEASRSGLVVCSVTPFGLAVNESSATPAEDLTVFHASGWGYHTPSGADAADPPLNGAGRFLPSYEAGLDAAMCTVAALFDVTGGSEGRFIDVSSQAVMASRLDYVLGQMVAGDMNVSADRRAFDLFGPAGIFPCADGYVYIWMSAPAHWDALHQLLGEPAWMNEFPERWLELACTPERVALCRRHIGEWFETRNRHAVSAEGQKLGLTMAPVNDARDLLECPQFSHRGFFVEVDHPVLGKARYPTVPYRMSETPARISAPAPLLNQHAGELLRWLNTGDGQELPGEQSTGQSAAVHGKPSREDGGVGARNRGGPLQGVRVVELTKVWAGPYAGKQLAYLGAEVIRVESLGSLDVTRVYGVKDMNKAPGFMAVNPEKLSVQIDMKTREGIDLILDLVSKADVLIENLRPGAIERLDLGYERVKSIKPDIVYVSMGMYGNDGPLAYQTGYAPCFAALGGVSALVGRESGAPEGMNVRYADSTFGTAAAYAATVALLHRRRSGQGQFIDVSAVECMSSMVGDAIVSYTLNRQVEGCAGNRHHDMAPHGVYRCRDEEWLSLACATDVAWRSLATQMGRQDWASDDRFATAAARKHNENLLDEKIAAWAANQDAAELAARLQQAGVAAAKSQSSLDLVADAALWGRGFFREVQGGDGSSRPVIGPSWNMSRDAQISSAAPRLGEHNAYILGEVLGLSEEQRNRLTASGIAR